MIPLSVLSARTALIDGHWLSVLDGDARARWLYERHYSCHHYKDGRRRMLFVGPGQKMVLLTLNCDALFVWRKFRDDSGQLGVNCAVFRNEGPVLSSLLIAEADDLAWRRWPGERLYTYVDPRGVRPKGDHGRCLRRAALAPASATKGGLVVLERLP